MVLHAVNVCSFIANFRFRCPTKRGHYLKIENGLKICIFSVALVARRLMRGRLRI